MKKDIGIELSRSIKERKWLSIDYQNRQGEKTHYWIGIKDVSLGAKRLKVDMFNVAYYREGKKEIIEADIYFENILSAIILEGTLFNTPENLYAKIEANLHKLGWLQYDGFDENILTYLKTCVRYDFTPFEEDEGKLLPGVDIKVLQAKGEHRLNEKDFEHMLSRTNHDAKSKRKKRPSKKKRQLVMNDVSIATPRGLFVVAYRELLFDISEKKVKIGGDVQFNHVFMVKDFTYSLKNMLDMDIDTFMQAYKEDKKKVRDEMRMSLDIKRGESLDERPYILSLARNIAVDLEEEYARITALHKEDKSNAPLRAFFGNMNKSMKKRKERRIAIIDEKVNIDQLRVIHNAVKHYITYVQGPPGTGKTQTILNVLVSAFFNDQSVLVASANNHPLDGIMDKITNLKHKDYEIPFPIIRLGNREYVRKALEEITKRYEKFKTMAIYEETLEKDYETQLTKTKELDEALENYEKHIEDKERLDALERLKKATKHDFRLQSALAADIDELRRALKKNPRIDNKHALELVNPPDARFFLWLNYMSIKRLQKLDESRHAGLREIIQRKTSTQEEKDARLKDFRRHLQDSKNFRQFLEIFPFVVSTLHATPFLGEPGTHFDLTVIDEAGQANIAIALPALLRGERLLLVGDPNQLRPVITIDESLHEGLKKRYGVTKNYDYMQMSILRLMHTVDSISKFILLRYHYRCHRDIIAFANKKYYNNQLILETGKTKESSVQLHKVTNDIRDTHRHMAPAEAEVVKKIVSTYKDKKLSVGVITPFRRQKHLIEETLGDELASRVEVGTIHSFQGDEKDVIIISSAIGEHTPETTFDWVKNNKELINVGTTRAKKRLEVVADTEALEKLSRKKRNDMSDLCQYIKTKNTKVVEEKVDPFYRTRAEGLKPLNTEFEREFFKTLSHITSIHTSLHIREKVGIKSVFEKNPLFTKEELDYYFKGEFDFVVFNRMTDKALMAIELDGSDHYSIENVKRRDEKKESICKKQNLYLLRVPNDYARRYELIRDSILRALKG